MNQSLHIQAIAALHDNYIWLLHDGRQAVVVDPGEAAPVLACLETLGLSLAAILVTHHHADHTGGVAALRQAFAVPVYGPSKEKIPGPFIGLAGGERVVVLGQALDVLDVPGHTLGHIAYFAPQGRLAQPVLFSGDTLFSAGSGRLFEGTAQQMLQSLRGLMQLPDDTLVCCGHEYTVSNLRFAQAVEPQNEAVALQLARCVALREEGEPTVPSTLALEGAINPFLRTREPSVLSAVRAHVPSLNCHDEVAVFAALREWKNNF